jgi:hypothetical protein
MTLPISLPTAPGVLDVSNTERATAADALRSLGVTQSGLAAQTAASRAADAQAIASNLTPPGSPANQNVRGPNASPNYAQPDYRIPPQRASVTPTAGNPLGA